jgi:hypothetical protein
LYAQETGYAPEVAEFQAVVASQQRLRIRSQVIEISPTIAAAALHLA